MMFDLPILALLAPLVGILIAGLAWLVRHRRIRLAGQWSPELAARARAASRNGLVIMGLCGLLGTLALAGPRGGRTEVTTETKSLSVVLAVDISRSMLAEDVAPSRLRRATREARRLIQDLPGDRLGLIAFAGRSYILSPLTVDGGSINVFLDALEPELASQGGTSLAATLQQGRQLLGATDEAADRVLVLFTDGEGHDSLPEILRQAEALQQAGIRLVVVGQGGDTPARIPVRDSNGTLLEYQRDREGAVVETWRRDEVLRAITDAAQGTLVPAALPDQAGAVKDLVAAFKRSPSAETRTADLLPLGWIPLSAALVLLLGQTLLRRGAILIALALLLGPGSAAAQRPSAGERALDRGDAVAAAQAFLGEAARGTGRDTAFYNAGTAALAAGRLDVARRSLIEASKSLDPDLRYRALYNLGVAGLLEAAVDSSRRDTLLGDAAAHLKQALLLQPGSSRAKWNLELALRHREPPSGGGGGAAPPPPSGGGGGGAGGEPAGRGVGRGAEPGAGRADPQLGGAGGTGGAAAAGAPAAGGSRRGEGLVIALLLLLAAQQAGRPELTAGVDRDRVVVGEELTLTLRATSSADQPLSLHLGTVDGFVLVGRVERSAVAIEGGRAVRTSIMEVRLRATRPGRWALGPFEAGYGTARVQVAAIAVEVETGRGAATTVLNPRVKRLLERAPPPSTPGEVGLTLILSADTVLLGEQVDLLTAAWFPRDLRLQLRRAPTLQPPAPDGTWSYPQPAPVGIAASREVGGRWYDLFVTHQIVFPLASGEVRVAPATLKYSVPMALQFFSQEERYSVTSRAARLVVLPLPRAGRPSGFAGAAGRALAVERTVRPSTTRVGEPVTVEIRVSGEGNVALWPAPALAWPPNARAYAEQVEESPEVEQGRITGSKLFRYVVLADSAGNLTLPPVEYPYFDLSLREYRIARAGATVIPVAPGSEQSAQRALPPPLWSEATVPPARRIRRALAGWGWALLALPPLLFAGLGLLRRRRPQPERRAPAGDLRGTELAARYLIEQLVPDAANRDGESLALALRAHGLAPDVAERVAICRERLRAARYAPDGSEAPGLVAGWAEVAPALEALSRVRREGRRAARAAILGLILTLVTGSAVAQQNSPEALYRMGALRAAAAGFADRVRAEPAAPAHRYNRGAALYRMRRDVEAAAEWQTALRQAPRSARLRRALALVPPPTLTTSRRLWVAPVTPSELMLAGAALWLLGWGVAVARRRIGRRGVVLVAGGALLVAAGWGLEAWYARPVSLAIDRVELRVSPHGLAPELAALMPGEAADIEQVRPGWLFVRAGSGAAGWVPDAALAPVGEYFSSMPSVAGALP